MLIEMALLISTLANSVLVELAALIGVEDLRAAVVSKRFLDSIDAERSLHRVRQSPGQDASCEPVHHGSEIDEAARHRDVL